ncbi:MAG: PAS domain-containing protein [Deltaproteobacteria bacterium]|nr:PAS domain-containing protein [Deltaproteobacteria bacterium]
MYARLFWLTFFRVILISVLLASTLVVHMSSTGFDRTAAYIYVGIVALYLLSLVYVFLLERFKYFRAQAYFQLSWDIILCNYIVYLTGIVESPFSFLYILTVVNAAILLCRTGSLIMATVASVTFSGLIALERLGIVLPFNVPAALVEGKTLVQTMEAVLLNVGAFYGVAFLGSYLAGQLQTAEKNLESTRGDLADITRLKENIVNVLDSGLMTLSLDFKISFVNQAAERITGCTADAVFGQSVETLFADFGERVGTLRAAAGALGGGHDDRCHWDAQYKTVRGEEIYLGFFLSPFRDSHDVHAGWILLFQDFTRYRQLEDAVRRAERLAAIGKMAADIAHEIRNPLAALSGSIEILKADRAEDPEGARLMDIVIRETDRLNKLLSDFLAFARPATPDLIDVDLALVCDETIQMVRVAKQVSDGIAIKTALTPTVVRGDGGQVKQIAWNLILNSIQAMPNGGEVSVRVFSRDRWPLVEGDVGVIEVSDRGIGIAPEDIDRVFDPFFTTKRSGAGLGLATVYRIVEAHGGRIAVESRRGEGTTFTVALPRAGKREEGIHHEDTETLREHGIDTHR